MFGTMEPWGYGGYGQFHMIVWIILAILPSWPVWSGACDQILRDAHRNGPGAGGVPRPLVSELPARVA